MWWIVGPGKGGVPAIATEWMWDCEMRMRVWNSYRERFIDDVFRDVK